MRARGSRPPGCGLRAVLCQHARWRVGLYSVFLALSAGPVITRCPFLCWVPGTLGSAEPCPCLLPSAPPPCLSGFPVLPSRASGRLQYCSWRSGFLSSEQPSCPCWLGATPVTCVTSGWIPPEPPTAGDTLGGGFPRPRQQDEETKAGPGHL